MNVLIAKEDMILCVPMFNTMKTTIDNLFSVYGGVYAMDLTLFLKTHDCVPLFESPEKLLERTKTARLLILIPDGGDIQRLYENHRSGFSLPLYMFNRDFYLKFVRAELILEYSEATR
jgi:hypothetical protein